MMEDFTVDAEMVLSYMTQKQQLMCLLRGNRRNKTSLAPNSGYSLTPTFVLPYRNKTDGPKPGKILIWI